MSKFQIVKGITDNLTETPYIEGKVYFVYDDINSTDLSIYADIDGARRKVTPIAFEEEDPTVPAWAKTESKPTYTASEVGALPANTVIPTKVSDLTNDLGFITDAGVTSFNGSTGEVTYTAPVTSVNGQTGAVNLTIPAATTVTQTLTSGTAIGEVNNTTLYAPNAYDDSALAARVTALENLEWATYYSGRQNPSDSQGTDGDIYLQY